MARRSTPKGNSTPRKLETAQWNAQWQTLKQANVAERQHYTQTYLDGRAEFYQHLWAIYEATLSEVLAAALLELEIYGLDQPNWRRGLEKLARIERGGSQADIAIGMMRPLIEEKGYSVLRAAEQATAMLGLFRNANSYEAAVQACREAWTAFKEGRHTLLTACSYFVRPVAATLAPGQVRELRDPHTMTLLPAEGMMVNDSVYWRKAIELGFVEAIVEPTGL